METRANYVAVGAFVVILLLGAAGVMLWVLGGQFNAKQAFFHMSFAGSVAGLTKDSSVRYNGVPVGKVTEIVIDKEHPNHVTVVVALDPATQIRQDAVASLGTQGLTGGSYRDQRRHSRVAALRQRIRAPGPTHPVSDRWSAKRFRQSAGGCRQTPGN